MMLKFNSLLLLSTFILTAKTSILTEKILHKKLLKDYNKDVLPIEGNDAVRVAFDFVLQEIQSLNVREQTLELDAFITMTWTDPQLAWNNSMNQGRNDMVMDADNIWTPDIALYNSADSSSSLAVRKLPKVWLLRDGTLRWVNHKTLKSSCEADITWWPWDSHTCQLRFGSLLLDKRRLSIKMGKDMKKDAANVRKSYGGASNGEWKITGASAKQRDDQTFRCCDYNFSSIEINLELKRLPQYYLLYTILPLIALILAYVLIFHLDIGQRASYGVTILLSISVYLLLISETLPIKSNNFPFIGITFVVYFFMLCLALPIAEYNVHVTFWETNRPPAILLRLAELFCCRKGMKKGEMKTRSKVQVTDAATNKTNTLDETPINYQKDWRKVGRCLDHFFTFLYLSMFIIVPLIVSAVV